MFFDSINLKTVPYFKTTDNVTSIGTVVSVGDGIARISGLNEIKAGALVKFQTGVFGMALNLEIDSVGCVLFGNDRDVKEGDRVEGTSSIVDISVGFGLLGRVVNALGEPIDGKGALDSSSTQKARVEIKAPGIIARNPYTNQYKQESKQLMPYYRLVADNVN
jgi:F-type H+-transporting ATPase subunit alpha